MSLATIYSRALSGVNAPLVTVETHLSNGLPAFNIVGLPEKAVKESKDRVRSAIINSHFEFPARRITVNLAPADLPKEGGRYDLPIALGILAASQQIPNEKLSQIEFIGELALTGEIRAIRGALPAAIAATNKGRSLAVALDNQHEAALCQEATVYAADNLLVLCAHLNGRQTINPAIAPTIDQDVSHYPDMSEVQGQQGAKRALEIAAAGQHNLLFSGPPGTGKTMLASRLPGLLPPLSIEQYLQVAAIYSVSQHHSTEMRRPFRQPHHTSSAAALVGGGTVPKPGEISLAHNGILFLDELPQFQRQVLEVLREPLESGEIQISRASDQVCFPAGFQLVAAMNPCPCGYFGDKEHSCQCTPDVVRRYQQKISGPLLDRIDIHLTVPRIPTSTLLKQSEITNESSASIRQRVNIAQQIQKNRQGILNYQLSTKQIKQYCSLSKTQERYFEKIIDHYKLSTRACHRILKVARTIADLHEKENIEDQQLKEAIGYRVRIRNK